MQTLHMDRVESPLGDLILVTADRDLIVLEYAGYADRMHSLLQRRYAAYELVPQSNPNGYTARIQAYFAGALAALDGITVSLGGTPFQQQVWCALRDIPCGAVSTYGELAAQLGKPNAARAVGITNSLNPIAIVVPCHRVIGSNRRLTGYASGLHRKAWLLRHEGVRDLPELQQISLL